MQLFRASTPYTTCANMLLAFAAILRSRYLPIRDGEIGSTAFQQQLPNAQPSQPFQHFRDYPSRRITMAWTGERGQLGLESSCPST
ncbi:uncharacterized protein LY79DRAFT_538097 [Colletotrichum navitas]|uniref:Uncharacterized protein n=1 Tax=Colletotrichum navitas TaxID=681940 RepID=A0AAD8QCJ9_9PEZI|nr:uncharacterized protein LY79DRAFT_538097 [Colletotrichum navitas]KAK1598753.1 hypothetical protein LY79DRAFT_538097 [Colletotrichum navitas]